MSKKLKLSPWHDRSVKPVHVGVYEVHCGCCEQKMFSSWNGEFFCVSEFSANVAARRSKKDTSLQLKQWRGILK